MAKSELAVCVFAIIACFCLYVSDATLCKPNSKFKLDCNTCTCSSTGSEFSCTSTICAPLIYRDKYLIKQNEKGYNILEPKDKNLGNKKRSTYDDPFVNDLPVGGKFRRTVIKMSPFAKRPFGNLVEQGEDYSDYDNRNWPSAETDEDTSNDYDDTNEKDDESDEDLVTYGKEEPKNRLNNYFNNY